MLCCEDTGLCCLAKAPDGGNNYNEIMLPLFFLWGSFLVQILVNRITALHLPRARDAVQSCVFGDAGRRHQAYVYFQPRKKYLNVFRPRLAPASVNKIVLQ